MSDQAKSKRNAGGDEEELQNLLENYLRKSEELEDREGKVLRQIELMRSTVSSLQAWNQSRKVSAASESSVHVDINEIEEETKKIKEETMRIQAEIEQKIEENKKLQVEIDRRKTLHDEALSGALQENPRKKKGVGEKEGTKVRALNERYLNADEPKLETEFFDEKVRKLKEVEKKLRRESETRAEELKKKEEELRERIKALERESDTKKELVGIMRNFPNKKK